jgi:hypothetical protein
MPRCRPRRLDRDRRCDRRRRPDDDGPRLRRAAAAGGRSGVAIGLPQNHGSRRAPAPPGCRPQAARRDRLGQLLERVERAGPALHRRRRRAFAIDPLRIAQGDASPTRRSRGRASASASPGADLRDRRADGRQGGSGEPRHRAGRRIVEDALSAIARGWSRRRAPLVVAGGETAGACVQALGIESCASAARSTRACRGAMRPRARHAAKACTSR